MVESALLLLMRMAICWARDNCPGQDKTGSFRRGCLLSGLCDPVPLGTQAATRPAIVIAQNRRSIMDDDLSGRAAPQPQTHVTPEVAANPNTDA